MRKKSNEQTEKEIMLIKNGEPKYPMYYNADMHMRFVKGNDKLGDLIWHYDTIPGEGLLKRNDGLIFTNIPGTCHGCCDKCKDFCYAINYVKEHNNSCIPIYAKNTLIIRHDISKFETELNDHVSGLFYSVTRPHISGEFDSIDEMEITLECAKKHPHSDFYCYTERRKWFNDYIDKNGGLPKNYVVDFSCETEEENPFNLPEFFVDDGTNPVIAKLPHCPAVDKNGNETGWTCSLCAARMRDFSCVFNPNGVKKAVYAHGSRKKKGVDKNGICLE